MRSCVIDAITRLWMSRLTSFGCCAAGSCVIDDRFREKQAGPGVGGISRHPQHPIQPHAHIAWYSVLGFYRSKPAFRAPLMGCPP